MAFKEQNLSCVSNNAKIGVVPAVWVYWNEATDTVTTAGYIPGNYGVKAKDQVLVIAANGQSNAWYYASVSSGVVTLTAQS
jgi:phage gp37-like protein